jgi:site-specific DNA-methyltransferase (adenine-specific)
MNTSAIDSESSPNSAAGGHWVHRLVRASPYYVDDHCAIFCGDALEILDQFTPGIDAVITDPPYCSGGYMEAQKNTKAQGLRGATVAADGFKWFVGDNMGTVGLMHLLRSVLFRCAGILNPNRSAMVFTDHRMIPSLVPVLESAGLGYRNQIIWDKGNAGLGVGFKPRWEAILEFSNGSVEYQRKDGQNLIRINRVHSSQKMHNAEKPVELIQELLSHVTAPGWIVLDPFMGSGTTLAAAKAMGRKAIGIERDPRNCDSAIKRLSQEVLSFDCPNA